MYPMLGFDLRALTAAAIPPAFNAATTVSRSASVVRRVTTIVMGAVASAPAAVFTDAVAVKVSDCACADATAEHPISRAAATADRNT